MIHTNEEGVPILKLGHLRAGHFPGLKTPPWGVGDLALIDLHSQFNLTIEDLHEARVLIDIESELVNATIQVSVDPRHGGKGAWAHPADEERWILDD